MKTPLIGIVMGSSSDLKVMQEAAHFLQEQDISFELTIVSAHRTPERMIKYAETAKQRGIQVIIAGAGGAAHLPGMIASITTLPVIGVPILTTHSIQGWDAVLSILQMPAGIPVATVALNGAKNAAILALSILAIHDEKINQKMVAFKTSLKAKVDTMISETSQKFPNHFDPQ